MHRTAPPLAAPDDVILGGLGHLTPREREVLHLIAAGLSNDAICRSLWVSTSTVETHIRRIFAKLDVETVAGGHRRVLAALAYLHAGDVARRADVA